MDKAPDKGPDERVAGLEGQLKSLAKECDEWRVKAGRRSAELERAKSAALALERRLKDSDAEARLKERDSLRTQMGEAMSRAAALERERDAAKDEAVAAKRAVTAANRKAEFVQQTAETIQVARDSAQGERDMLAAKLREAEARIGALTLDLEEAKKPRAPALAQGAKR